MPEILAIKNLTVSHSFRTTAPTFVHNVSSMPVHPVDEVVIRSIIWNGEAINPANAQDYYAWMIQSNINNGFIGCFAGGNITMSNPGTRILLNAPFPNQLEFRLVHPPTADNSPPLIDQIISGDFIIQMDLISYRRSHVH